MIETNGERESDKSVQAERHDIDDEEEEDNKSYSKEFDAKIPDGFLAPERKNPLRFFILIFIFC